jgi:alginate O-acetyltransferase complex protein AlgJ
MNREVYEGRDGWLFLQGGSNKLGTLYDRQSRRLPDTKLHRWKQVIEYRARKLEALGIQYVHVHVPEKQTIYDNKFRDPPIVDWRLSPARRLGEMMQESSHSNVWLDLTEPLRALRDADQLYLKTDTHWSAAGCFCAYRLICARIGITPDLSLLDARKYLDYGAYMDLGSKLEPPVAEVFRFYDFIQNAERIHANPIARYLETMPDKPVMHVGSQVTYSNEAPSAGRKRIMIFGDSYSSQRGDALTGMLAETASEVEFIWSSNLDWAYIRRIRPDVVVYELAERFLTVVPNDRLSLRWILARRGLRAKWLERKGRRRMQRAQINRPPPPADT